MTPLEIRLELARTEDAADPHAFHTGPQDYLLRWPDGAFEPARLVWSDELMHELAAVRLGPADPELARRLGERLHRFLAPTRFATVLSELRAALAAGRPVHLEVLAAAAELYALPWELLTPGDGRTLGEIPGLQIHYAWPGATAAPPAVREGGRVLLASSNAFGNVGEAHAVHAVAAACRAGFVAFEKDRDLLVDASLPGLVAALERRLAAPDPPTVLHILAHGAESGGRYGLGLHDGRGDREVVDAAALRRALAPFAPHLRLVVLMACDSGNPGPPGAHLGSAVQELHRAGFAAVVGSRYPLTGAGALEFTKIFYHHLLEETASVDAAFAAARVRLARGPALDWASLQLYRPHGEPPPRPIVFRPHRGLLAFEREHARFFFGRDPERREAIADLDALTRAHAPRLLVVAGASGTGKSSVVLAGVVPEAIARGWAALVVRPGAAPLQAVDAALARRGADERPYLLVVDQFEEVFTHASAEDRVAVVRRLWDMSRSTDGHARVVLTMSVNFLGRCGELALDDAGLRLDRVAYDEAHRVFVAQMDAARLAETITGPAARLGLTLEPGLPARLLHEIGGDPVGLPLLQYALDELWQRRTGDTLTHAALDAIGGVHGALARHADGVVDRMAPDEQLAARRALVRLAAYGPDRASGTRRRVREAALRQDPPGPFDRAVAALVAARLVVRRDEQSDGAATLEVAHEALIRGWDRLWRWYEEARANLTRREELDAIADQARAHHELLAGNRLVHAEALARALADDLDEPTRAFLRTSRAAEDRARTRRRRALVATWLGLFAGLVLVGWLAVTGNVAARRARDSAALATATAQLELHPHVAAALLREVHASDGPRWRQLAYLASQSAQPTAALALTAPPVTAAALGPDGAEVLLGHEDGSLRLAPLDPAAGASVLLVDPGVGAPQPVLQILAQPGAQGWTALVARRDRVQVRQRDATGLPVIASGAIVTPPPVVNHSADPRFHRDPVSGRVLRHFPHGALDVYAPEAGALVLRDTRPDCPWFDPQRELLACRSAAPGAAFDRVDVTAWTATAVQDTWTRETFTDQPLSAGATVVDHPVWLWHDSFHFVISDPPTRRLLVVDQGMEPIAAPDAVRWRTPSDELCEHARGVTGPPRCDRLPPDCPGELLAQHPTLGALVRCGGARPRAMFIDIDPELGLFVRHELALPDGPIAALLLTPDLRRLVAVHRDAHVWQWDLHTLPSGFFRGTLPAPAALAHGALAAVSLEQAAQQRTVIRTRWGAPDVAPDVTRVPLPPPATPEPEGSMIIPCCAAAHAGNLAAAFRPLAVGNDDREFDTPTTPDGLVYLVGDAQPAPQLLDLPLSHRATVLAMTPDAATLVYSQGLGVHVVDRAAPTAPRLELPAPVDRADTNGPRHRLVRAAVHPRGSSVAAQWNDGSVLVGEPNTRTTAPLRPPGPARCGAADPAVQIVTALAYAPDGRWLAVGRDTGRLELLPLTPAGGLDPAPATAVTCAHRSAVTAIAFSADATTVVSGDAAGGVALWTEPAVADTPDQGPIFTWVPGRPAIDQVAHAGADILVLTAEGRPWFTPAAATNAALRTRLAATPCVGPTPDERAALLLDPNDAPACAPPLRLPERAP